MIKNSIQSWDGHSSAEKEEYIKRNLRELNEQVADIPAALEAASTAVQSATEAAASAAAAIAASKGKYKKVSSLPTASADTIGYIFLTPGSSEGVYNMSYTEQNGDSYSWEDCGTTELSLDGVATKEEVSQLGQELSNRYLVSGYLTSAYKFKITNDISVHSAILKKVNPGEKYYIIIDMSAMPRGDNRRVAYFTDWVPNGDTVENPVSHTTLPSPNTWYELTVPAGAYYMVIQTRFTPSGQVGEGDPYGYHLYTADEYKLYKDNKDAIADVAQAVEDIEDIEDDVETIGGEFEYVLGDNLFDKTKPVGLGYINLYGNVSDNSSGNYTYSYLIPVKENTYYYLSGRTITGSFNVRCLDESNNPIKVLIASTGGTRSDWALPKEDGVGGSKNGQFKTPAGAKYFQFNIKFNDDGSADNVMLTELGAYYMPGATSPQYEEYVEEYRLKQSALPKAILTDNLLTLLKGKTVCIFGGSVSRLCNTFGGSAVMEKMSGVAITNKGHDGGGYAKGTTIEGGVPSFEENGICDTVNAATQVGQPVYDIYLLWSSTNDLYVTPGDPTDYSFVDNYDVDKLTTQCGGMNYCIKKLQEFSPESRIIIIGSMESVGLSYVSDFERLQTLVEKQAEVAKFQSLPFFSLWANSGVNYYNRDAFFQWTVENEGESRNDGTHPNKWAYQNVIGPKIIKQIALLY